MGKQIAFTTGILNVSEDKISFASKVSDIPNNQTLKRSLIGGITNQSFVYLPRMTFQYGFRFGFGGLLAVIISALFYNTLPSFLSFVLQYGGILSLIFGLGLIIIDVAIDGLFGTNIALSILQSMFGVKGQLITISNANGGKGIEFCIPQNELSRTTQIESLKIEEQLTQNQTVIIEKKSDFGDLEKLAELKEKGIITEEEFNKKKADLLGL